MFHTKIPNYITPLTRSLLDFRGRRTLLCWEGRIVIIGTEETFVNNCINVQ